MGGVIMKMNPGDAFIRRRGKVLCVIDAVDGLNVTYHTWPELIQHKVSPAGFRVGFRPATPAEAAVLGRSVVLKVDP